MARIKIGDVRETLEEISWEVLSPTYTNLDTMMTFQCSEGHKVQNTWRKLRNKIECPVCKNNEYKTMSEVPVRKKTGVHRVLAVDQSSRANGYSVFDNEELVTYGVYECTKETPLERIVDISEWLINMIHLWKPDEVGFEETQYSSRTNHNVFKLLSQVMGACMLTAAKEQTKVRTVLISTWRHHCGVKGRSRVDQKRSAQFLVKSWYDISVSDDESDAICLGKYFSETYRAKEEVIIGEWQ